MSTGKTLLALFVLGLVSIPHLVAQSTEPEPISTERPSVGTGPDIISPLTMQFESGINVAYSSQAFAADLPENFVRLGIGHRIEVRFASANLMHQSDAASGVGFIQAQDLNFGFKRALAANNSVLPQAVAVALSCPTGASTQTSGSFDPSTILIWEQVSHNGFSLTENLSLLRTTGSGVRKNNWGAGIVAGRAISAKLSWFAEYAPMFAADAAALHIVDGGLTYTPRPTTQLDLRIGHQNDPAGLHNFLSLGYSFRVNGLKNRLYSETP